MCVEKGGGGGGGRTYRVENLIYNIAFLFYLFRHFFFFRLKKVWHNFQLFFGTESRSQILLATCRLLVIDN